MARSLRSLVASKKGVMLDVSFGGTPQPNSVTLGPKGDVRCAPQGVRWPLPTGSVHTAVVTHVLEYVDPARFFDWFDELHRVMRPLGIAYFSGPYGGDESQGWLSDPTHRTRVIEQSFSWLDPRMPFYALHPTLGRRTPKPWYPLALARVPAAHGTTSYNATLQAQPLKRGAKR